MSNSISRHSRMYCITSTCRRWPPFLIFVADLRRSTAQNTTARLEAVLDEPYPDTEEGRNWRLRTRLFRRLLDDPVVYFADLDEQERQYLISQRPSIVKEIEAATGLVQEARREGVAMIDPDDEMMDVGMPEEGTDGHITLLVADAGRPIAFGRTWADADRGNRASHRIVNPHAPNLLAKGR